MPNTPNRDRLSKMAGGDQRTIVWLESLGSAASGGGGGSVSDGNKGDITVSGLGTSWAINSNAVTFAKMQDMAANTALVRAAGSSGDPGEVALSASTLLGRGSTGDIAAITLGSSLFMAGTVLSVDSLSGAFDVDDGDASGSGAGFDFEEGGA